MPQPSDYLNDSPQGVLRQIIFIQITIAFLAVFLIIATAKPNQYHSESLFSTLDTNPYTIFTASDHVPTLLAFVYSIWAVTGSGDTHVRPSIILFTTHPHTAKDVKTRLLQANSSDTTHNITILWGYTTTDNKQNLWKAAVAESRDDVLVWMDPGVTVASAHLLRQLPRLVHQKGGRWSVCRSETVCTIVGLDTSAGAGASVHGFFS